MTTFGSATNELRPFVLDPDARPREHDDGDARWDRSRETTDARPDSETRRSPSSRRRTGPCRAATPSPPNRAMTWKRTGARVRFHAETPPRSELISMRHYRRVLVGLFCSMFAMHARRASNHTAPRSNRGPRIYSALTPSLRRATGQRTLDAYTAHRQAISNARALALSHRRRARRTRQVLRGRGESARRRATRHPRSAGGFRLAEALAEQHKSDAAIAELQRSASARAL